MTQTSVHVGRTPAVSVCIPLYMKERFVAGTVRSILDQTFTDFELVVLHNASPDRSAEIVASFDDPRIRLVHNAETIPGPDNVTRAAGLATAPLVKIVAADDTLLPEALERQVAVLADPQIAVVSCRQNMIGEHDEVIYRDRSLRAPDLIGRRNRTTVVRRVVRHVGNPIGAYVNLMYRRSAYEAAGGMPDVPWMAQDLAVVLETLRHGDFYGLDETLVNFRIASGSDSATHGREGLEEQVRYIDTLRRAERAVLRPSDTTYGRLRTPVMRCRHQMIVAAAGPPRSIRTRAATRVLSLSRASA